MSRNIIFLLKYHRHKLSDLITLRAIDLYRVRRYTVY
jgi:hypothetical protein